MREPTLAEFEIKLTAHEQRDVDRFAATMEKMTEGFKNIMDKLEEITNTLATQIKDHEMRIRYLEGNMTKVLTYGSAAVLALGLLQFGIQMWFK